MLAWNGSDWRMLAVLERRASDGGHPEDNAPQYLTIMLFKAWLNACGLGLGYRSLRRSLLGFAGISLCLADTLLLCAVAGSWALRGHVSAATSLCFAMSHASTVYSLLPIPFLLLGALDYGANLSRNGHRLALPRGLSCCTLMLTVWGLAGLYSYRYTNSQVQEVSERGAAMLVCIIQSSWVVTYFCTGLTLAISCALLFHCQREPRRFLEVVTLLRRWVTSPPQGPRGNAPFSHAQLGRHWKEGRPDVPLLPRLTLGFALTWAPFLVLSVGYTLLDVAVPSYLTVNLIWLLCANSLLVGAALWYKGNREEPCGDLPDDTCEWSLYWRHGNGEVELSHQEKLTHGIYTLPSSATERLLHI